MKRAKPGFVTVRPYGKTGDRKCDGIIPNEGTIFQVYSPDNIVLKKTETKINEDLAGAVENWRDSLRNWIFVYNCRRGLPADVLRLLAKKRKQYPKITIDQMSSDRLWEEYAIKLNMRQKAEVFGPPVGHEHLFFPPRKVQKSITGLAKNGCLVLIQDVMSPINVASVFRALKPRIPFGPPLHITPPIDGRDFSAAGEYQEEIIQDALNKSRDLLPRFAVFSLAPIPLAIQLGFVLSDRVEVQCFQFNRTNKSWKWKSAKAKRGDDKISVSGFPSTPIEEPAEVLIRISLSASISQHDTHDAAPQATIEIDFAVTDPGVMWLQTPKQLDELAKAFRACLAEISKKVPNCSKLHVFYAGPTGGAVVLGQQINPRMNPPVILYEYSRQKRPRYKSSLTLKDD